MLRDLQKEAWAFLSTKAKAKARTYERKDVDDEQVEESPPVSVQKRARSTAKLRQHKIDDDDEPSAPLGIAVSTQLHQHVQHEKEHEKEHKRDLRSLHSEIDELKKRIDKFEAQCTEVKEPASAEVTSLREEVRVLRGLLISSSHQLQVPSAQPSGAAATSFVPVLPQAAMSTPPQLPFGGVAPASGGYFWFPPAGQQAASARLG